MLSIPFNPYTWGNAKQRVNSDVLALDFKDDTRKLIKVSNLSNNVIIVTSLWSDQTVSFQNGQYNPQIYVVEFKNTLIIIEITPTETNRDLYVHLR